MLMVLQDRGEGANHGITDVALLVDKILPVLKNSSLPAFFDRSSPQPLRDAIDAYEKEMIQRTGPAVLLSRQACLDAHNYEKITDRSPLISRRAMVTTE